jgi:hypothetical protein
MKKLLGILLLPGLFFVLPTSTLAATVRVGETVSVRAGDVVHDNLYLAGGNVSVEEVVFGDLIVAGGNIRILGNVLGDLMIVGGNVTVLGPVNGDVRVAGGNILINGAVSGDLVAVGGSVSVLPTVSVGRDTLVAGGNVSLSGTVDGNVKIAGGMIDIDSRIEGDVTVKAQEKLLISDTTRINGELSYTEQEGLLVTINDAAVIAGGIVVKEGENIPDENVVGPIVKIFSILVAIKLLTFLITALILVSLFKKFSQAVVSAAFSDIPKQLGRGFIALVVIPVAAVFLCITILGSALGGILFLVYGILMILAALYSNIIFGNWILKMFKHEQKEVNLKTALIGTLALFLVALIPVLGVFLLFFFVLLSLGAITELSYKKFWLSR